MRPSNVTPFQSRSPSNGRARQLNHENQSPSPRKIAAPKAADYHQLVARATNDAVRDLDLNSGTLLWRQGLDTLLGYSFAETDLTFWRTRVHPSDRARVATAIKSAVESDATQWSGEYRFQHADGSYRHLLERAIIVRDKSGVAQRFLGVLMDVTERKQLQDQLSRSQKMEAFGQLAGGMAHDFNNFLTAILGYSDLVVAEIDARGTIAKYISEIRSAAGRAASLTRQLLAFSRRQPLEPRVVEINTLISNLERSILRLLGEHIAVICDLVPEKAHIKVDQNQFTQIIVNLAVNARDAMPSGGTLILKTATVSVHEKSPVANELAAGDYVVISMIDNGCGMSDEVKSHVFEPFFSTKDERHSSGLGLATCYGIVRQSGGHISLESDLGKGTAVHIYLPKVGAPNLTVRKTNGELPKGNETVLIVEDEASVRHVAVRTLRMLGYKVLEAWRADLAKRCIAENPSAIDLVVTDIMLPDMSGREFAHWARIHTPHTQIVLISGYLSEGVHDHDHQGAMLLPKPFDPEQLATTVRKALNAGAIR